MKKNIRNIVFLLWMVVILTGCSMFSEEEDENLMYEKTKTELQYIEDQIFNITNKYAKDEYVEDDKLNWDNILEDEKQINETLETIILDLSEINISKEDLVLLSSELNDLLMITLSENETGLLSQLNNLYTFVPKCLDQFSNDKNEVKEKNLKSIVLSSYALANGKNWAEAKITIQTAVDQYNTMMNDVDYMQAKSYKLNRVYVLLGEVKNAIDIENLELLNVKFVNFIEKM